MLKSKEIDTTCAYRVEGYRGIAWRCLGPETEPDEDTEWTGHEIRTGNVVCVMVGDDRKFSFKTDDLTPLYDLDYCLVCGQIRCQHDGRSRP